MNNNKKNKFKLFLLISILIHLILLLIVLTHAFKKTRRELTKIFFVNDKKDLPKEEDIKKALEKLEEEKNQIKKEEEKKEIKLDERPAALKPRKSNFGNTTYFDEEPQFVPPISEKIAEKAEQEKFNEKSEEEKIIEPDKILEKKEIVENKEQKKDINQTDKESKFIEKKEEQAKTTLEQAQKQAKQDIKKEILEIKKQETKPKEVKKQEIKIAQNKPKESLEKKEEPRNFGVALQDKSPAPKPKKSILQLTKGFLYNNKDEGQDWIKRDGDENKRPDFEDLKRISYTQQIAWQFQQESGIIASHMSYSERTHLMDGYCNEPNLRIVLNKNGSIKQLELINTSGSVRYDDYIVKCFKNAAPFPPIPNHFNSDQFDLPVTIMHPSR
ncbi:TonB C-terminal domain-containing protein [Candidatus Dependentiae bacterium]|nr:TonB C-terminal domain-containing protein [Candidatus Dependentiae bacterium]MBU4387646.1 TonB C-terminal domain-containing protein [Candidatus Dependentiae bacterium]MCG2756350.1 TonB C-terminal domain-containing protein [Candidatus Dependentiae bacterium]